MHCSSFAYHSSSYSWIFLIPHLWLWNKLVRNLIQSKNCFDESGEIKFLTKISCYTVAINHFLSKSPQDTTCALTVKSVICGPCIHDQRPPSSHDQIFIHGRTVLYRNSPVLSDHLANATEKFCPRWFIHLDLMPVFQRLPSALGHGALSLSMSVIRNVSLDFIGITDRSQKFVFFQESTRSARLLGEKNSMLSQDLRGHVQLFHMCDPVLKDHLFIPTAFRCTKRWS